MPAQPKAPRPKRTKAEQIAGRAFEQAFKKASSPDDQRDFALVMAWIHRMIHKGEEPSPDQSRAIRTWWPFLAEVVRQLDPPRGRHTSHPIAEGNRDLLRWNHGQLVAAYKSKDAQSFVRAETLLHQALTQQFTIRRVGPSFAYAPRVASGYVASGDKSEARVKEAEAFLHGIAGSFIDRLTQILTEDGMTYHTYMAIIRKTKTSPTS